MPQFKQIQQQQMNLQKTKSDLKIIADHRESTVSQQHASDPYQPNSAGFVQSPTFRQNPRTASSPS